MIRKLLLLPHSRYNSSASYQSSSLENKDHCRETKQTTIVLPAYLASYHPSHPSISATPVSKHQTPHRFSTRPNRQQPVPDLCCRGRCELIGRLWTGLRLCLP